MPTATLGTPATITFPTPPAPPAGERQPKSFIRLAGALGFRHCSRRTEQTYMCEAYTRSGPFRNSWGKADKRNMPILV